MLICPPAVGQAQWVLNVELMINDTAILQPFTIGTALAVLAERAMNRRLQGGCQVPIGCFAQLDASGCRIKIHGLVGSLDGQTLLKADNEGSADNAEQLGEMLADKLLAMGAGEILASVYGN